MEKTFMETYRNKHVLVTGGCGFIGINLILDLLKNGAVVTVLDLPHAEWNNLPSDIKQIKADILNKNDLSGIFSGIEIIFHLAARTDLDGKSIEDYIVNYEGTKNLIEEASKAGSVKRFVYFSTQLVVGLYNEKKYLDETEPYKTKTYYGASKIEGEKNVIKLCSDCKMPYTIIRPTSVYGPWGGTPYKEFFRSIKKKQYYHIGKANNLVSWVYVKNLTTLTLLCAVHNEAENEIYFANDMHPYTMREIVNEVAAYYGIKIKTIPAIIITPVAYIMGFFKLLGFNMPLYPFRLRNMRMTYVYNIQKSLRLGYSPEYGLKRGIHETLDWYESRNLI